MTKSIITLVGLLMLATPAQAQDRTPMNKYLAMTKVEPRCSAPKASSEIIVCGRRRADRWRVPYLLKEAGDPSIQNVSAERNLLASEPRAPCGTTAFFATAACGKVGLSVSTAIGGESGVKLRPLAD
jgi:hypothetical protein